MQFSSCFPWREAIGKKMVRKQGCCNSLLVLLSGDTVKVLEEKYPCLSSVREGTPLCSGLVAGTTHPRIPWRSVSFGTQQVFRKVFNEDSVTNLVLGVQRLVLLFLSKWQHRVLQGNQRNGRDQGSLAMHRKFQIGLCTQVRPNVVSSALAQAFFALKATKG